MPPNLGYGNRGMGPIPAGSTLSTFLLHPFTRPPSTHNERQLLTFLAHWTVFETELMGIDGVPKPEKIVTKETTAADSPSSTISAAAEEASAKIAEKIASKVGEAADVVKTLIQDTDDVQEHNEL